MSVTLVVGAQYGSEGKGNLVHHLADRYDHHVRVGGPNAGHSFQHEATTFKMQSLPCGWTNKNARLYIGAGAVCSPDQLLKEMVLVNSRKGYDPTLRTFVDFRATILDPIHHQMEGGVNGEIHQRIGSTGEGVGAARVAHLQRDPLRSRRAQDVDDLRPFLMDTVAALNAAVDRGDRILVEGTQGSALSITHGPWPHVTTSDPNASGIMADCGFAPSIDVETILVARTYPIRVAGASGPMANELSWDIMSERIGREVEERTTVTRKVRRVGEWDDSLFEHAVTLNRPQAVCVNFIDYLSPEDTGKTDFSTLSSRTLRFIEGIEVMASAPVMWVGTGGPSWAIAERKL